MRSLGILSAVVALMGRGSQIAVDAFGDAIPTQAPAQLIGGRPPQSRRTVAMDKRAARKRRNVRARSVKR